MFYGFLPIWSLDVSPNLWKEHWEVSYLIILALSSLILFSLSSLSLFLSLFLGFLLEAYRYLDWPLPLLSTSPPFQVSFCYISFEIKYMFQMILFMKMPYIFYSLRKFNLIILTFFTPCDLFLLLQRVMLYLLNEVLLFLCCEIF